MNSLENSSDKIGTEKENQILNNSLVSYFDKLDLPLGIPWDLRKYLLVNLWSQSFSRGAFRIL